MIIDNMIRFESLVREHGGGPFLEGSFLAAVTLKTAGSLSVVWAPFEFVNEHARLVLVGITPGRTQAENGYQAFRNGLLSGKSLEESARLAKLFASFSGNMRENLVRMLDHVGAQRALGIASCADLFGSAAGFVHFTSALPYPVFKGDADYNGAPSMLAQPILRNLVETVLAEEARQLPDALWLPLGTKPLAALSLLVQLKVLRQESLLCPLPHPSGANNERISFFLERKPASSLSVKTAAAPLEQSRQRLRAQFAGLRNNS